MRNYAHRGFKSKFPENTMIAFKEAVKVGAQGIEFDVHLTKDGQVVIIHDERLDRTTDGTGRIMDYNLNELKNYNAAKGQPNIGFQGIPTLEEYILFIKDYDIITNCELKTGVYWYKNIEEKVYELFKKHSLLDRLIISSFNHKSILKMKALDSKIPCGLLIDSWLDKPWEYVKKLGCEYYHPSCYAVDKEMVDKLHEHNIGINVWFGVEPYDYKKIYALGVDGLITDHPDKIKSIMEGEVK